MRNILLILRNAGGKLRFLSRFGGNFVFLS